MQLRILLITVFTGISFFLAAQPASYPKNYFSNPMGITMEIQSNFGELRPDHWHMGLDIRTNQKENLPIYTAAGGYIARIGIRPQSFGRFIVINHPNGLSTLYGHLNDFFPALEQYVTEQQYKQESWAIELNFSKNQFPVSKGQFIAYSGNTGGSLGPHLHFEIFDTQTEKRLNPLLLGFPVSDNVPPTLVKLAMYDRGKSTYEQLPLMFSLKKTDSGYVIPKIPVIKTGKKKISFALQMYDKMNGNWSKDGVYSAEVSFDDVPQISFILDSIDYDETLYLNANIDYKIYYNGGDFFQHVSQLPGSKSLEYKKIKGNGVLELSDTTVRKINISVKDAYGNTAQLNFAVQHDDSLVSENFYNTNPRFIPGQVNVLEKPGFKAYLPENCLYDTIPEQYSNTAYTGNNAVSEAHSLGNSSYPVHGPIAVRLKQYKDISEEQKRKLVIVRDDKKGKQIKKAEWQSGWITAKFADFGNFQAFTDLTPPIINDLGKGDTINLSSSSGIVFTPADNFGIIKTFRAEIDSQWIRFTNDKSRNWKYKFDERCPYGVHHLKVTVKDLVGNETVKTWWFKRYPYTPPPKKKKTEKKGSVKNKVVSEKGKTKKPVRTGGKK